MGGDPNGGRNTGLIGNRPARRLPRPDYHYLAGTMVYKETPQPGKWVCLSYDVKKDAKRV